MWPLVRYYDLVQVTVRWCGLVWMLMRRYKRVQVGLVVDNDQKMSSMTHQSTFHPGDSVTVNSVM